MGHVIEPPNPVDAYSFSKSFGVHLLPDYGPVCSVKTPRADPHAGCCGGWGRKPPATRLYAFILAMWAPSWTRTSISPCGWAFTARPWFKTIGTFPRGGVRFSLGPFNTEAHVARAVEALSKITRAK